jgi:hypothetical protein
MPVHFRLRWFAVLHVDGREMIEFRPSPTPSFADFVGLLRFAWANGRARSCP